MQLRDRLDSRRWFGLVLLCGACLWVGPACDEEGDDDDDDAGDDDAAEGDLTIEVSLSEHIPTVALVTWEADVSEVDEAYVEFGTTSDYGMIAPMEWDGETGFSGYVLGMKAATDYVLRATLAADGQTWTSGEHTLTTGLLPTALPDLYLQVGDAQSTAGGYLALSLTSQTPTMSILDRDGDFVWWYQPDGETYLVVRSTLSRAGDAVLYMGTYSGAADDDDDDDDDALGDEGRYLVRVSIDGSQVDTYQLPGAHHDFVELPDGTLGVIGSDRRDVEGHSVNGACIVEVSPEGTEEIVWTAWDVLEYNPDEVDHGWTHANALDYDEVEDAYYISIRNYNAIFKIDRASGDVLWMIGGPLSDFSDGEGATEFWEGQHQFDVLDGSILVFDNQPVDAFTSRVVEYAFDPDDGSAELIWIYQPDPAFYCYGLGDADRLPNGNTLITWSTSAQLDEVDADGNLLWQLNSGMGAGFGYTTWLDSLYR